MFHLEGLGYQEIAVRLEVPLGTVATWVMRGRKAVASAVAESGEGVMAREELPKELLWEGKHASELALSAFADGEESLLSKEIVLHLHTCTECAMHLGETALVTRGVTHAVNSVKPWLPAEMLVPSVARASAKRSSQSVPWRAVFAALALTAVGSAPTLMALPHRIAAFAVRLLHAAPVVSHSGVQVFQQGLGAEWAQAMGVCAALLIASGFALTRLLPRPTVS